MTRTDAKNFNNDVQTALKEIFAKYGMSIDKTNITYNDYEIRLNLKATKKADSGVKVISPSLKAKIMWNLGYNGEDVLERTFKVSSLGPCKIVDYNSRCSRYPFVVQDKSGKMYKTSKSSITID